MASDHWKTGVPHGWPYQSPRAIWVDPNWWGFQQGYYEKTITTTGTQPFDPMQAIPGTRPQVDEEAIRKIVREEIADLPIPFDVPDEPPES